VGKKKGGGKKEEERCKKRNNEAPRIEVSRTHIFTAKGGFENGMGRFQTKGKIWGL